jgi:hypothetical protein
MPLHAGRFNISMTKADVMHLFLNKLPVPQGEFGVAEANALISRLNTCRLAQNIAENRDDFNEAWSTIIGLSRDRYADSLGIYKVEQNRADVRRQQDERARKEAAEKEARTRATAEAEAILEDIRQLSTSSDLNATYKQIATLQDRIKQLPPDIQSNVLDALQVAVKPIYKQKNEVLSELQRTLLEVQGLPDNEDKLHRLSGLTTNVRAVPEPDANTLAEAVEATRSATRTRMSEAANASDAATLADKERLEATIEEERARERVAQEVAAAAKAERDRLKAHAAEAVQNLGAMMAIYSVANVCAKNQLIYDDHKLDALKEYTRKYIQANGIPREQVDNAWTLVQQGFATTAVTKSDCTALGNNINAVFGSDVFNGVVEKNPF